MIGHIVKKLDRELKNQNSRKKIELTFVNKDDNLVLENAVNVREEIGIGNEILKIARLWRAPDEVWGYVPLSHIFLM